MRRTRREYKPPGNFSGSITADFKFQMVAVSRGTFTGTIYSLVSSRVVQANKVSSVGVISHTKNGGLAANLSASDLQGLLPQHFAALAMPVLQFLTVKASAIGWPQHKAVAGTAAVAGVPGGGASAWGLKVCSSHCSCLVLCYVIES